LKVNPKLVIFAVVVLTVGAIFVVPYLNNDAGNGGKPGTRQFATTPNPVKKLDEAKADKRPVYLEFYAVT